MNSNREIITLQLGDYANHIASHFWNLEWENSNLYGSDDEHEYKTDDKFNMPSTDDINTTNPYKSSAYNKLKPASKQTHSNNTSKSGNPSKKNNANKNINPNICFYSNKQQSSSSQSIKNKLNINRSQYVPRTIIFASNGSEGNISTRFYESSSNQHMNINNNHNNNNNSILTWDNGINVIQQQQTTNKDKKNETKNSVQFWSDYLLPPIHDKSLFLLPGIHHFSTPFHLYSTGYDLLNNATSSASELREDIDDRIRWFVESCDWFQGFQIFSSHYDSFSGFLPSLINLIHDDYSNKCVLLYDCQPSSNTMMNTAAFKTNNINNASSLQIMNKRYKLNSVVTMAQIWDEISNIIPITVDSWNRENSDKNNKFYNTSIIGSCLHHYTNAARIYNTKVRMMDIINCTVKSNSMKLSMLSSCSSHLDLDMNFQAINSIEKLLMTPSDDAKMPIFSRLSCLGPIAENKLIKNNWRRREIFGEYSCLNGTDLYDTSPQIIQQWQNNKMILAQKMGSSKSDIDLYMNEWRYDKEKRNYHFKLMTKLATKTPVPLKWNLIQNTWKLPKTHPFYYDAKRKKQQKIIKQNEYKNDNNDNYEDKEDDDDDNVNRNNYSIWSSGWSANVIGDGYLNECGKNVSQIIQLGNSMKMFGDIELDLHQHRENLFAWSDSYAAIEELEIE